MKCRALILAAMIVASGLLVGSGVQAQTYSGSIVFRDGNDYARNYFKPSDSIRFDVTVLEDGFPLQYQTVNVVIVGNGTIGQVFSHDYTTNEYGQFSGDHTDDFWYTRAVGFYTMYVNYTGSPAVNGTFRIYDPIPWSATGWTSGNDVTTDVFTEDQQVTVHIRVLDQYGNPFNTGFSTFIQCQITRDGDHVTNLNIYTDISGEGHVTFNTWNRYQNQFGDYTVTVYNDANPREAIGSFGFTVALPDLATIQLSYFGSERAVFREGEIVGYSIFLYHQDTLPYDSNSYAARLLLFKEGQEDPLRNDTLSTDSDGHASEYNYHPIAHGEAFRGRYHVTVYNRTWHVIGTAMFMVIEIEIGIQPEKDVYAQGDRVTLTVTTTLEEAYRVTITDSSGTTVPGASWNVPAGTAEWWRDYTFPSIPDGEYRINVYMDDLLLTHRTFLLKKITLQTVLSQTAFVPGQSGMLLWRAVNNHDGAPISVTGDSLMHYVDNEWAPINRDLDDISGSSGSFDFTVPRDALLMSGGDITTSASDSGGHSDTSQSTFQVRPLQVNVAMDRNSYMPGDTVFLTVTSLVSGTSFPVPSVETRLTVTRDGAAVGNAWTVTTNSAGTVSTTYRIPTTAERGIWVLVVNATFGGNSAIKYNNTYDLPLVTEPIVSLILLQEKNLYEPGETVTVPYNVLSNGAEISGARVTFEAYISQFGSPLTIALGFGNNGIISFALPENTEGFLAVHATATTPDGQQASGTLSAIEVSSGQLLLLSVRSIYLPGEVITWTYNLTGDTVQSSMYRITDPDGVLLEQGIPGNGTIEFQPPENYTRNPRITLYVIGSGNTYFATSTAQVYNGYILQFRILRNSYSPGDVMRIEYTISKVGNVPDNVNGFRVDINIIGEHSERQWVMELSGILEYRLSDDISDGRHVVSVTLQEAPGTFADVQTIIIDSEAGELAHGTILGMNAGAFISLLVAIIALVVGIVGLVKWKSLGSKGAESPEPPAQPADYPPPNEPAPEYAPNQPLPPEYPPDYPPPPQE